MLSIFKRTLLIITIIIIWGYLIPNKITSPISKNRIAYIDSNSFWFYPWGLSGVHKGIDIFCEKGTNVISPINGIVYKANYGTIAGNYIYIIGPKWRTYYFAHLDTFFVKQNSYVSCGDIIGKVGNTGNAIYKPTHLHYSIETVIPYFWLYESNSFEGYKKMFYLNPKKYLDF